MEHALLLRPGIGSLNTSRVVHEILLHEVLRLVLLDMTHFKVLVKFRGLVLFRSHLLTFWVWDVDDAACSRIVLDVHEVAGEGWKR